MRKYCIKLNTMI